MIADDRRAARERALGLLYEAEAKSMTAAEVLAAQVIESDPVAQQIVAGIGDDQEAIDARISSCLTSGWRFERLASIDRAILRIAVYELMHRDDVPTKVVLNEAIELAKIFSTEDSGKFVNGVLAAVARQTRPA